MSDTQPAIPTFKEWLAEKNFTGPIWGRKRVELHAHYQQEINPSPVVSEVTRIANEIASKPDGKVSLLDKLRLGNATRHLPGPTISAQIMHLQDLLRDQTISFDLRQVAENRIAALEIKLAQVLT